MAIAIDTLVYAKRLREAGFSELQAEALAVAMTDSLATKQDLRELGARMDARFAQVDARFSQVDARFDDLERHLDTRLVEQERRLELRFAEQTARFDGRLAGLERRGTLRLGGITVAGVGVISALVKLL